MAEAVENASIIMPFLCRDYERSKNCEKELSYADTKNKNIIPILIEPNYKPSGWLALVISRFKYIDVSHTGGKAMSMCKQLLLSFCKNRVTFNEEAKFMIAPNQSQLKNLKKLSK